MTSRGWRKVFAFVGAILAIEGVCVGIRHLRRGIHLERAYGKSVTRASGKAAAERQNVLDTLEQRRYQATGSTVYDRIYNRDDQDIVTLIRELSREALPAEWKTEVRVEGFTNFILVVDTLDMSRRHSVEEVSKYLVPVVARAQPYLKNVAVFDRKHHCYLYFDEGALKAIGVNGAVSNQMAKGVAIKGHEFTKFNSVRIDVEVRDGHILVPVTVSGEGGYYESLMLLDTGASMTVISLELAQKTGSEDLNTIPRKEFHTANGVVRWPIVKRMLSVGSMDMEQDVAVSLGESSVNLLGVDIFSGTSYLLDAESGCIHIWGR